MDQVYTHWKTKKSSWEIWGGFTPPVSESGESLASYFDAGPYISILTATILCSITFSFVLAYADIDSIKKNWNERRCDVGTMIAAGLYKPDTYTGSFLDFASENFNYCGRKIADNVIREGMRPLYSVAEQQAGAQASLTGPLNNIRTALARTNTQFSDYMNTHYLKYTNSIIETVKSYFYMRLAMGRFSAIVVSLLYMMISGFIFMGNMIQFGAKAIKIFLGILTGMMILLFPVLAPFSALIAAVTAIISGVIAGVVGSIEASVCCDPKSSVKMADGSVKSLDTIQIGDCLLNPNSTEENKVLGILVADGSKTPLYEIDGVRMSGSHSIEYNTTWILAKDHPEGLLGFPLKELICLNTTRHIVPLIGKSMNIVNVSDWEEVSSLQGQKAWIDWVHLSLNGTSISVAKYPTSTPLLSPSIQVTLESNKKVPIHTIKLGDRILSRNRYTTVKAIYTGVISVNHVPKTPEWISDGVWLCRYNFWATSYAGVQSCIDGSVQLSGFHLITEDETFMIERDKTDILIRDFTEVGLSAIDQSYEMIQHFMNKK